MSSTMTLSAPAGAARSRRVTTTEPAVVRWLHITISPLFLGLFLPQVVVFSQAVVKGFSPYLEAIVEPDARSVIQLTLLIAAICAPMNLVFGVAAVWAIAKFDVRGKSLLTTLIDLPFAASPVISGLICMLVLGAHGWFGELPAARAMGEFGGMSVVSGHIRGLINTMPLYVEILYDEYNFVGAFVVASLLALLAMVTLAIKTYVEWQMQAERQASVALEQGARSCALP